MQDMDGKEVEGRFLGVKHDKFNAPAGDTEATGQFFLLIACAPSHKQSPAECRQ